MSDHTVSKISSRALFILVGVVVALLLTPSQTFAADVCCQCTKEQSSDKACFSIDESAISNSKDCTLLPSAARFKGAWTCEKNPLDSASCKAVSDGGVCAVPPTNALLVDSDKKTSDPQKEKKSVPDLAFQANVSIPGFNPKTVDSTLLGQYIVAVYRYGISIVAVVATIMFIVGAFLYLLSASLPSISAGKSIMFDSIIGLLLVISATMILRTINPKLTSFSALEIEEIQKLEFLDDAAYRAIAGGPAPSATEVIAAVKEKARATGISELPCFAYASMVHESGGRMDAIGHDENAAITHTGIPSRRAFINSGVTYKGTTFPPVGCSGPPYDCQKLGPKLNDDAFNPNSPPDYDLDWRFSHGFGAFQSTIFPESKPCSGKESAGRGFFVGTGKNATCYTIPELLTAETATTIAVQHYQAVWKQAKGDVAVAYALYAGIKVRGPELLQNKMIKDRLSVFEKCKQSDGLQ